MKWFNYIVVSALSVGITLIIYTGFVDNTIISGGTTEKISKQLNQSEAKIADLKKENELLRKKQQSEKVEETKESTVKQPEKTSDVSDSESEKVVTNFLTSIFSYNKETGIDRYIDVNKFASKELIETIILPESANDNHKENEDVLLVVAIENIKIYNYDGNDYFVSYDTHFQFEGEKQVHLDCIAKVKVSEGKVSVWDQVVSNNV